MKRILPILALLALPAAATDYYLIKNETARADYSSLDGCGSDNSNFSGWAETQNGTAKVQYNGSYGAVDPTGVYHLNGHIVRGKPSSMNAYSFQGGELVFDGTNPALNDKMNDGSTLTIGSLRVVSGTHGEIRNGDNGHTKTLAGNWTIEAGGMFGLNMGDENKDKRSFVCTATVSGEGTFAATAGIGSTTSTKGSVTLTGDLFGFKGVLSAGEKGATYTGTHAAAVANRSLVIGAASAWPQSTPDGDVLRGSVVVTNGATLAFTCSVDSAEIRGWTFGSGAMPTIDVASGCTVTIKGPVEGTVGFKKTGEGTLVLDVGGEGAYQPISLTGTNTVSAVTLSAYVARCEEWLAARNNGDLSASVSVGSVQMSSAVVTVSITALGADATSANVTVQVSEDSAFASPVATETFAISGDTPIVRSVEIENLEPSTTYYARAIVANNADASCTTAVATFTTARSGSSDKIVPGLEAFGTLTLVDEIDCANDTSHRFRDYPVGRSYVTNILGRLTRVMHHVTKEETSKGERTGAYVSWRIGEGKGIVPNDPYLLVVDYPDDAPRSVTLFDFGIAARHGYHTGFTVGESMSPQVSVPQVLESVAVPFSHEWKQLVEVVFPFERATQYDGGSRIDVAQNGFDIDFVLVSQDQATDSVGLAVQSIKLYRIDDYAAAKPEIHYPAGGAPRRYVTSREEMGDNDGLVSYDTPVDYYVGKARIMSLLGMNCFSKDLLEFGYVQHWSSNRRWGWNDDASLWSKIIDAMTAEGHYLLPQYEYHGSRGDGNTPWDNGGSLGYDANYRPWTLESAQNPDWKYLFSNASWVKGAAVDLMLPQALVDLKDLMDRTILTFKDRGNFVGAWIRSRGGMPVGFSDKTIALFNEHRAASGLESVTREQIWNGGAYIGTPLHDEYLDWWYGKRRDLFAAVRAYMVANGLPDAKFFYHSCAAEGGRPVGDGVIESFEEDSLFNERTWRHMTGRSGEKILSKLSEKYWTNGIGKDGSNAENAEGCHADPHDDYDNYRTVEGVALSYPFNAVYTVAGPQAGQHYRNASGDLVFLRHYSLNEFCANDYNLDSGQAIVGYYTTDMDHAGRAVMVSELFAMAVNDPTILGYLFGSNLTRLDAPAVREFNLNFLSLPAIPSTVLSGGTCGDAVTVRRWTTSAGNYWAVINVTGHGIEDDFGLQTSKTRVWRTVDWREEAVSGGTVHLRLKPYQMVCLTDVEPAAAIASPVFGEVAVDALAARTATVSASLTSFGEGAASASVAWTLFGGPADATAGVLAFPATGAQPFNLSGLAPDTAYSVSLEATASTGEKAYASVSFTTPRFPVALGVPVVSTDPAGTTATASVTVDRADADATLVLASGGATVSSWTHVVAGETYSGSFPVVEESTVPFAFTLVHVDARTGERYETAIGDVAVGVPSPGWLDIRFDRAAYDAWPFASSSGRDPSGGAWTRSGGFNATAFATDGGNRRLELAVGQGGLVRYAPDSPSRTGYAVHVKGRAQFVAEPGIPEAPSGAPVAGLALGSDPGVVRLFGGSGVHLYGWTANGWVALEGAPVAENEWIDWTATVDFTANPATVSYGIGGTSLFSADGGATNLPAAGTATTLSAVVYEGDGVVDDFRGVEFLPVVVEIKKPSYEGVPVPMAFVPPVAAGESGTLELKITLTGQPAGTWFTAFECETLSADPADWVALTSSVCPDVADLAAGSVCLSVGTEKTSKFVKIVASDHPIALRTALSDLAD